MAKQKIRKSDLLSIIREQVKAFIKANPQILEAYGWKLSDVKSKDAKMLGASSGSGSDAPDDYDWYMPSKKDSNEVKKFTQGSKKAVINNAPAGATEKKPAGKKFSFNMSKGKKEE